MKVLVATNNAGKVERYRMLLADTDAELFTPRELGIEEQKVIETGATLEENAQLKARAYFGKTVLPILSNDSGFYVEGEGFIEAPKRITLEGKDEHELSKEQIADAMVSFWRGVAGKYGGQVDAAWIEAFALLTPDGTMRMAPCRREVILTSTVHGPVHVELPIRALYISKTTGKASALHTHEEDIQELAPVRDALISVLVS